MDFKIEITCERCTCKFELRAAEFKNRDSLECQNCGQPFPNDVLHHLRSGVIELSAVPDTVPDGASSFALDSSERPQFSLRIKEYDSFLNR